MFTVVFFPLKVHHLPVTRCLSVFLTVAEPIPSALMIWSNRKTAMTMRAVLKFEKWKLQRVAPSGTTHRTPKSGLKQERGTGPSTFGTLNHTVSYSIFFSGFFFNISKQPDPKGFNTDFVAPINLTMSYVSRVPLGTPSRRLLVYQRSGGDQP